MYTKVFGTHLTLWIDSSGYSIDFDSVKASGIEAARLTLSLAFAECHMNSLFDFEIYSSIDLLG